MRTRSVRDRARIFLITALLKILIVTFLKPGSSVGCLFNLPEVINVITWRSHGKASRTDWLEP
jgi:hypothetical protein